MSVVWGSRRAKDLISHDSTNNSCNNSCAYDKLFLWGCFFRFTSSVGTSEFEAEGQRQEVKVQRETNDHLVGFGLFTRKYRITWPHVVQQCFNFMENDLWDAFTKKINQFNNNDNKTNLLNHFIFSLWSPSSSAHFSCRVNSSGLLTERSEGIWLM